MSTNVEIHQALVLIGLNYVMVLAAAAMTRMRMFQFAKRSVKIVCIHLSILRISDIFSLQLFSTHQNNNDTELSLLCQYM